MIQFLMMQFQFYAICICSMGMGISEIDKFQKIMKGEYNSERK